MFFGVFNKKGAPVVVELNTSVPNSQYATLPAVLEDKTTYSALTHNPCMLFSFIIYPWIFHSQIWSFKLHSISIIFRFYFHFSTP
jgi:hypothetical protein